MENKDTFSKIKIGIFNILINSVVSEVIKYYIPDLKSYISDNVSIYVYQVPFILIVSLILTIIIIKISNTDKGHKLFQEWVNIKNDNSIKILINLFKLSSDPFKAEERWSEEYQSEIIKQIKGSNTIYFLLLSAYTMFYDEKEKFIFEAFDSLTEKDKKAKDIKFLILYKGNGEHMPFKERGRWFVKKMNSEHVSCRVESFEEYLRKCNDIEKNLKEYGKVSYYYAQPCWRMLIFDNIMYVSVYHESYDGHLTPIYRIDKNKHKWLFEGYKKYFNYLLRHERKIMQLKEIKQRRNEKETEIIPQEV